MALKESQDKDITAITVVCNTPDLMKRMYKAFRKFHPNMMLYVIDNSDKGNECREYLDNISSTKTRVYRFNKNIGHGRGLNFGICMTETPYALIMDSDTVILKDPVKEMMKLMTKGVYGVGWISQIGKDGYDYGTFKHHKVPVKYLHPYFCLLSVEEYSMFPHFVHHGAPFYKTMVYLHDHNLTHKLIPFPGLTGGPGMTINWNERESEYVRHDFGGTRIALREMGRKEIEEGWAF